jgi:hypothetical protein
VTNPKLKPFEANNLDLGLEYYMTREAYVSASGFAKDIISRPGTAHHHVHAGATGRRCFGTVGLTDAQQAVGQRQRRPRQASGRDHRAVQHRHQAQGARG